MKIFDILTNISIDGCGTTKEEVPNENITFESLEEMQECLNGKWFSMKNSVYPIYTELVFNNHEIKKCQVYGWSLENDINDAGEIIGTKYELQHYENLKFKEYGYVTSTPQFEHKKGQVIFNEESLNINIKEYINVSDGKEIKEKFLLIGSTAFFKATDKTDLSCDNFEMFLKFCEVAIANEETLPFTNMQYSNGNEELGIEKGIDEDRLFTYEGCDSDEISFEISNHHDYRPSHYFARTDEFKYLYDEINNLLGHRTNIIGLIGTEMPDFDKKDWQKSHKFEELKYYLYMNSEGKLVSNVR